MWAYALRRLLLMIPTLFGILLINFVVIQFAPGGPIEQVIAQTKGTAVDSTARFSGGGGETAGPTAEIGTEGAGGYRGAQGLDPKFIKDLEKQFGFDKPAHERFLKMVGDYMVFDFGTSFFRGRTVSELIVEKLPVSISLGLWSTLIIYLICIPLGVWKAVRDGSRFDIATSVIVLVGYSIPSFLLGVLLIILFAGGTYWQVFPLRGLYSDNWDQLDMWGKVLDYAWHVALPTICLIIGGFASLTMLTKNSFIEEIRKQYVVAARAKGLTEGRILFGHVFRNAMLIVIAGFPAALIGILFTDSLLIEVLFSLDGLGYLGYDSAIRRDYPVVFGTLYIFTLIGLVTKLISDLTYAWVDPRIDFEARDR